MTLYDIIMGGVTKFNKIDWRNLGKGLVKDPDVIKEMLMEGYEAIAEDD